MCCRLKESSAYEELREQLERQCEKYRDLDITGDIGRGRYKEEYGKWVPNENIGEYLRGGVVSTMAVFEAFMSRIIEEAFNVILYKCKCKGSGGECSFTMKDDKLELRDVEKISLLRHAFQKVVEWRKKDEEKKSKKNQKNKMETEEKPSAEKSAAKAAELFSGDHPSERIDCILEYRNRCIKKMTNPLLHTFDETFRIMFNEEKFSIAEKIFSVTAERKPIEYHYPLDKCTHTVIKISEEKTVCAILRLWYGIRCISAHGMAIQTFSKGGALYKFPDCDKCQEDTQNEELQMLHNGLDLCGEMKAAYESKIPKPLEGSVSDRRYSVIPSIPNVEEIQSSENEKACELVDKLKLKQDGCSPGNVYYHISRIAFFASKLEKRMYITYRLLVRINQFVLLLAFRIKLAVAKYLVEYSKKENEKIEEEKQSKEVNGKIDDLKEGLWKYVVNDDEKDANERVQELIDKVQRKHKEKIEEIQKSTEHHFCTGACFF